MRDGRPEDVAGVVARLAGPRPASGRMVHTTDGGFWSSID